MASKKAVKKIGSKPTKGPAKKATKTKTPAKTKASVVIKPPQAPSAMLKTLKSLEAKVDAIAGHLGLIGQAPTVAEPKKESFINEPPPDNLTRHADIPGVADQAKVTKLPEFKTEVPLVSAFVIPDNDDDSHPDGEPEGDEDSAEGDDDGDPEGDEGLEAQSPAL